MQPFCTMAAVAAYRGVLPADEAQAAWLGQLADAGVRGAFFWAVTPHRRRCHRSCAARAQPQLDADAMRAKSPLFFAPAVAFRRDRVAQEPGGVL